MFFYQNFWPILHTLHWERLYIVWSVFDAALHDCSCVGASRAWRSLRLTSLCTQRNEYVIVTNRAADLHGFTRSGPSDKKLLELSVTDTRRDARAVERILFMSDIPESFRHKLVPGERKLSSSKIMDPSVGPPKLQIFSKSAVKIFFHFSNLWV
jgi:hypothetical protein